MYYIICFSKFPDLLSQWRGYADDGKGFSIGVNLNKICESNKIPWFGTDIKKSLGFSQVIYNFDQQCDILLNVMRKIVKMDFTQAPLITALMNLSAFATIFKNPYYFEERETRLICAAKIKGDNSWTLDGNWILDGIFEHTNSVCKTTHIELDLMKHNLNGCIEYVVLGPKNKHTTDEIYEKLHNNGFLINKNDVVHSKGTYR